MDVRTHPRKLGWLGTTALALGGGNPSLFILGALVIGQGTIPGQGTAAFPLRAAAPARPVSVAS